MSWISVSRKAVPHARWRSSFIWACIRFRLPHDPITRSPDHPIIYSLFRFFRFGADEVGFVIGIARTLVLCDLGEGAERARHLHALRGSHITVVLACDQPFRRRAFFHPLFER